MSQELIKLPTPVTVQEAVSKVPDLSQCLGWGIQSMERSTVRSMILLASSKSEHFRYALGVTPDIAQYLYDLPEGAVTSREHFIRCNQQDTLIGHFDTLEVHVIQEMVDEEDQCMMLLVLNDEHLVDSYLVTRLREYADHVVVNNILPKKN